MIKIQKRREKTRKNGENAIKSRKSRFFTEKREFEIKDFAPTTYGRDRTTHGPKGRKKISAGRRTDERKRVERDL